MTGEIDFYGITAIDCRGHKVLLAGRMHPSPTSSTDGQNLSSPNSPIFLFIQGTTAVMAEISLLVSANLLRGSHLPFLFAISAARVTFPLQLGELRVKKLHFCRSPETGPHSSPWALFSEQRLVIELNFTLPRQ